MSYLYILSNPKNSAVSKIGITRVGATSRARNYRGGGWKVVKTFPIPTEMLELVEKRVFHKLQDYKTNPSTQGEQEIFTLTPAKCEKLVEQILDDWTQYQDRINDAKKEAERKRKDDLEFEKWKNKLIGAAGERLAALNKIKALEHRSDFSENRTSLLLVLFGGLPIFYIPGMIIVAVFGLVTGIMPDHGLPFGVSAICANTVVFYILLNYHAYKESNEAKNKLQTLDPDPEPSEAYIANILKGYPNAIDRWNDLIYDLESALDSGSEFTVKGVDRNELSNLISKIYLSHRKELFAMRKKANAMELNG